MTQEASKSELRRRAVAARAIAHAEAGADHAAHLAVALEAHLGRPIAGYAPMRTEIDPMPAMRAAARHGPVALPVMEGAARPLRFRQWLPGCKMTEGPFGVHIPAQGGWITPEVLIVPLLAFDRHGGRVGYGGGYYDRTLEALRAAGPTIAIGFAFAAQQVARLPLESTDQPLDLVVTERGIIAPEP